MSENNGAAAPVLEQVGVGEALTKEKFVSIGMALLHKLATAAGGVLAITAREVAECEAGSPVGFDIKLIDGVYAVMAEKPGQAKSKLVKAPASMADRFKARGG